MTHGKWPALLNFRMLTWILMMIQKMEKIRIPICRMRIMSQFVNATRGFEGSHLGSAEHALVSPVVMALNMIRYTNLIQNSAIGFSTKLVHDTLNG